MDFFVVFHNDLEVSKFTLLDSLLDSGLKYIVDDMNDVGNGTCVITII